MKISRWTFLTYTTCGEFMNGLRRITFHSCAKTGADDENRKGGRTTLIMVVQIGYILNCGYLNGLQYGYQILNFKTVIIGINRFQNGSKYICSRSIAFNQLLKDSQRLIKFQIKGIERLSSQQTTQSFTEKDKKVLATYSSVNYQPSHHQVYLNWLASQPKR